ncbi:hypothetical protein AADG42_04275 [Ammonicoccus fulvus]|uniref:Uncharacterized protein n=1 Tax=Ammonicoccus fulvus TaxID=3138240 RepID=A0ABZ3FNW5_9ACTN
MIIAVVVLSLIGVGVWVYFRQRWIKEFEAKGWTFDDHPGIETAYGLNAPPFGQGDHREVKDLVSGTIDGLPFRVLNYQCDGFGGWMATWPLPRAYPQVHIGAPRPEVAGYEIDVPGASGITADPDFDNVLVPAIIPALAPFGTLGRVAITIDGAQLTVGPIPHKAEEMEPFLRAGTGVARAIVSAQDRLADSSLPRSRPN